MQLLALLMLAGLPQQDVPVPRSPTLPWVSDQGDGTYINPVLAGDWSDPDVVRVGDDYYLTASSFANVPGLPILHSRDLVNWRIIGHALPRNLPDATFVTPRRGGGVWAPAIRHHRGRFMIYYPDPDRGIFMVSAKNPAGPWTAPVLVDASRGAIDPAPFWDDDGKAWLVMAWAKSRAGFGNRITIKPLSADGKRTTGDGAVIIDGETLPPVKTSIGLLPWTTIEGPKLHKHDGYYYLFSPAGGVKPGWQSVFRSRNLTGPYEGRDVLDQGKTDINGPHQGAWVSDRAGADWFLHFQDVDSYGRLVHLQPMQWRDGWPVIGADPDGDGIGEPVLRYRKPASASPVAIAAPQTDDNFDGPLSLAWQWNANPQADWLSLSARKGWLRLKSASMPANLYEAGNLLSQKLPGRSFTAQVRLDFAPERVGEQAGLAMFGYDYAWIGLRRGERGIQLVQSRRLKANENGSETDVAVRDIEGRSVWLKLRAEPVTIAIPPSGEHGPWASKAREIHARVTFSYSLDGRDFRPFGEQFTSRYSRWVGAQIGLFAMAPTGTPSFALPTTGHGDFDDFEVGAAGP